jgi:APOBEC-like N-terminal domain
MPKPPREMNASEVDAQSVHATVWENNNGGKMALYGTFHSGNGPHAENRLAQYIKDNNIKGPDTSIVVYLTKSPCTSTPRGIFPATRTDGKKGCAEMLADLANQERLKFTLLIRNVYSPSIAGSDRASVETLKWLWKTGNFAFAVEKVPRSKMGQAELEEAEIDKSARDGGATDEFGFALPWDAQMDNNSVEK